MATRRANGGDLRSVDGRTRGPAWVPLAVWCCLAACSGKSPMTNMSPVAGITGGSGGAVGAIGSGGAPSATAMTGAAGLPASTSTPSVGQAEAAPGTGGAGGATAGASGSGGASAGGTSGMAAAAGSGAGGTSMTGCTRDSLKASVDAFFTALAAHKTDGLTLATGVKYTENAMTMMPGEGVWKTAGMVKFKRTAVDTTTCMTATESVIPDGSTDRVYGVRLELDDAGKISEIETILVTNYILINPQGLVDSKSDDWETVLTSDKQMPRDKLQAVMDKYLEQFPSGACGFADSCTRLEDGGSVGKCVDGSLVTCNMSGGGGTPVLNPRLHVIDVEAGITVGFTVFLGGYDDFHLFKVRDGQVQSVHAVLTQTNSMTGWN